MKHSLYAPSAAHRWLRCAASLKAPPGADNEYTSWGIETHEIAARMLLTGLIPEASGDEQVQTAAAYARKVFEMVGSGLILGVEIKLGYTTSLDYLEEQEGTIDCVALVDNGHELQIHDLKTGMGVIVHAKDNEQLMIYALAALDRFHMVSDIERVRLVIHQQRANHFSEHVVTLEELRNFGEAVMERITEIEGGHTDEIPGDVQCRFCGRKAECASYEAFVDNAMDGEFENVEAEVATMGSNRLADAMGKIAMVEQWCKAIRAKVEAELLASRKVPGWKLVRGRRGARQWIDEGKAIRQLQQGMRLTNEQAFTQKVISPSQVERLLKAGIISDKQFARLAQNITQSEGGLSVAPADDSRPEALLTAADHEFADELERNQNEDQAV